MPQCSIQQAAEGGLSRARWIMPSNDKLAGQCCTQPALHVHWSVQQVASELCMQLTGARERRLHATQHFAALLDILQLCLFTPTYQVNASYKTYNQLRVGFKRSQRFVGGFEESSIRNFTEGCRWSPISPNQTGHHLYTPCWFGLVMHMCPMGRNLWRLLCTKDLRIAYTMSTFWRRLAQSAIDCWLSPWTYNKQMRYPTNVYSWSCASLIRIHEKDGKI